MGAADLGGPLVSEEPKMAQRRWRGADQYRIPAFSLLRGPGAEGGDVLGACSGVEGQQECPAGPVALDMDSQHAGGVIHLE